MNVLFLLQNFVTKSLADSAGFNEIAAPLIQSGLVSNYEVKDWAIERDAVDAYIGAQVTHLKETLCDQPVVIYGAGDHTQYYWPLFSQLNIVALADKQEALHGTMLHGVPVIAPEMIGNYPVIISSRAWEKSIYDDLSAKGKEAYKLYESIDELIEAINQNVVQSIFEKNTDASYDLIVYTPADPSESLSFDVLQELKSRLKAQLAVVWWDYDDTTMDNPYTQFEISSLRAADCIIDPGNFSKTRKMQSKLFPYQNHPNVEKIKLLATPVNEDHFYPRQKSVPVAIFGSKVGLRGRWIDYLLSAFANDAFHFGGVSAGAISLSMDEYARLVGQTKIVVNTQTYSFRTQCKGKVREALASGALLIEQDNPDTREFIGNADFIKFFSTEEQLHDLIDYYLAHDDERAELAQQGYDWYMKHWSSKEWSKKVLSEFTS